MSPRRKNWVRFEDERLLDMRICDLGLTIEPTSLAERVAQLHDELAQRGIRHTPHVWLSSEWFSPDGVPGIAVPFYLAHPRLRRLEKKQMLVVEGGTTGDCMRILRHEAGHAIDTAYRLHRKERWRKIFGNFRQPYPKKYRAKPNSRNHVVHLAAWYAQAHPAEDFAETFAVWLTPRSLWRKRYSDWYAALAKLEYVDELMREIAGRPAAVRSRARVYPLTDLKMTLRQHYRKKRAHYGAEWDDYYDRDLERIFSDDKRHAGRPTAAAFLRGIRHEIRERIAEWTGAHTYTVDQVLQDMIERSREKKLRLAMPAGRARQEALLLVTVHTMNCMHWTHLEIPL